MASPTPPPILRQQKQIPTVVWILLGIVGLVLVLGASYFAIKVSAGKGTIAFAKKLLESNQDLEVVSTNGEVVKVLIKSSGETVEFNLKDLPQGKIDIQTSQGQLRVLTNGKTPKWLPKYPDVKNSSTWHQEEDNKGTFTFQTRDDATSVADFYEKGLKSTGFNVDRHPGTGGNVGGVEISGTLNSRSVQVVLMQAGDETFVSMIYEPSNEK